MTLAVRLEKNLAGFGLDVDFACAPGLSVLFGDSGAGKTMTLRLVAGLLRPDRGRVTLGPRVLYDAAKRTWVRPQQRRIGYVFQHESVLPHLTVRQNVLFGGRGLDAATRQARCDALLDRFQLLGLAQRWPQDISGGQKQRVCLARALMQEPAAMLLDEPFSALDLVSRQYMRVCLVDAIRSQGVPALLVTHDLIEALSLADTLLIMIAGRIVQRGAPRQVLEHPADERVAALVNLEHLRLPPW